MQIPQFKKYVAERKLMVLENYWELSAGVETGVVSRIKVFFFYLGGTVSSRSRGTSRDRVVIHEVGALYNFYKLTVVSTWDLI